MRLAKAELALRDPKFFAEQLVGEMRFFEEDYGIHNLSLIEINHMRRILRNMIEYLVQSRKAVNAGEASAKYSIISIQYEVLHQWLDELYGYNIDVEDTGSPMVHDFFCELLPIIRAKAHNVLGNPSTVTASDIAGIISQSSASGQWGVDQLDAI